MFIYMLRGVLYIIRMSLRVDPTYIIISLFLGASFSFGHGGPEALNHGTWLRS